MDTSYAHKAIAWAGAAVRSPRDLPSYFATLPPMRRTPLQLGVPWFSFAAIRELRRILRPEHEIFEFGSGGSTLFFGKQVRRIVAVESHADWLEQTRAALRRRALHNVELHYHSLEGDLAEFRSSDFFRAVTTQLWDAIVIDCFLGFDTGGLTGKGLLRPFAFEMALQHVKPGGCLVLDDSWMFPELLTPRAGWELRDFVGLGPCRWGVTSTAIWRRSVRTTGAGAFNGYTVARG